MLLSPIQSEEERRLDKSEEFVCSQYETEPAKLESLTQAAVEHYDQIPRGS